MCVWREVVAKTSLLGQARLLWNLQGLPQDKTAIENAAILSASPRTPLVIDPDGYFTRWIVERSSSGKLQRETAGSKSLKSTLLHAVEFGWSLMIERIERQVEPILLQAAANNLHQRGMSTVIHLSGKEIEYNPRFRLFLGKLAQVCL